mmetsp:Transcript_44559/g.80078  ORF Transcript_44559/g.80078 Transcript_44559/m.80078 type:complete len:216 (-) Transcript_44559:84-731(-)
MVPFGKAASILALLVMSLAAECPPSGFDTQAAADGSFDIKWYTNAKWYVQEQMVISYLPVDYLRCVTAEYELLEKPTFFGYDIKVMNHAENKDGKDLGPLTTICAQIVNSTAGKFKVSPCFLPSFLAGPYWVVAFNKAEGWSLVSGGPPTESGTDGCKTGTGTNDSGLWIFTRKQQRDEALVQKIKGIARDKGFDISVLKSTDQTNCAASSFIVV